jgi:hypothetical protein
MIRGIIPKPSRTGYVGTALSAEMIVSKTKASGHAEAKVIRMQVARAVTLGGRSVANSAMALRSDVRRCYFEDFLLDAPHQPECRGVQDDAHVVGIGRAARGAVAGDLGSLIHLRA